MENATAGRWARVRQTLQDPGLANGDLFVTNNLGQTVLMLAFISHIGRTTIVHDDAWWAARTLIDREPFLLTAQDNRGQTTLTYLAAMRSSVELLTPCPSSTR